MRSVAIRTPGGFSIFCDDIREELRGKVSFMGIYGGDLILSTPPPVHLPKLMVAVNYYERPGESTEPVELRLYLPGDDPASPAIRVPLPVEEMRAGPIPSDPEADDPLIGCKVAVQMAPVLLKQEGRIKVRAYRGDDEIRLGSLLISTQRQPLTVSTGQMVPSLTVGLTQIEKQ